MVKALPVNPDDADAAFDKALRILNAAAQTSVGLTQKLRRGGYTAGAAETACRRVVEMGYVNDAAYAEALVGRRLRQGRGKSLIGREMGHKGLDQEIVAAAMGSLDPDQEYESALELATKLVRRQASEPDAKRRRDKVLSALARRGFSSAVARRALVEAQARLAEPV